MFKGSKEKDNNYISTEEVDKIYEFQKKAFNAQIAEQNKKIEELVDYISARFGEDIANSNIATRLKNIEKNLQEIETNDKTNLEAITKSIKKEIEKEFQNINQKISKINYLGITSKFDKKIKEKCGNLDGQIAKIRNQTEENITKLGEQFLNNLKQVQENFQANGEEIIKLQTMFVTENEKVINNENRIVVLDKRLTDKIKDIDGDLQVIENSVSDLDKNLTKKIDDINEKIQNTKNDLEEKISKEIENANESIQDARNSVNNLEEKIIGKIEEVNAKAQNNEMTIVGIETNLTKKFEQTREAINRLKDISKNKNIKLEEKIKLTGEKVIAAQEEIKKDTLFETEKIKYELNEQIINYHNENKAELESITVSVEDIRCEMENTITSIEQEISKLKQELKASLESQDNAEIELLKKDYNKYVTKMNNELAKISKDLLNAQKKNLEQNRNLQVKIKAYIDAKVEKACSTEKIEELINKLNLSLQEREKLQKIEMEELLNKKLKAIQKENERILNKKIEEISSKLIRENSTDTSQKLNNITLYEDEPKKRNNMYELIDEKQILKRSATSKNSLKTEKEGKSQILKFFYDEE